MGVGFEGCAGAQKECVAIIWFSEELGYPSSVGVKPHKRLRKKSQTHARLTSQTRDATQTQFCVASETQISDAAQTRLKRKSRRNPDAISMY